MFEPYEKETAPNGFRATNVSAERFSIGAVPRGGWGWGEGRRGQVETYTIEPVRSIGYQILLPPTTPQRLSLFLWKSEAIRGRESGVTSFRGGQTSVQV
jgi:hypothetical protein